MRRLLLAAPLIATISASAAAQTIPIKPGVVLTYASQPIDTTQRFDFERDITVASVTPTEWHLLDDASNQLKPSNKIVSIHVDRTLSHREATLAREIWLGNQSPDVDPHRGTSWMAASAAVMKQLRANGEADITVGQTAFEATGTLHRIEPADIPLTILVNGARMTVPTMHTRIDVKPSMLAMAAGATAAGVTYDFWFIDDTSTAWIVRETAVSSGHSGLQELVRVQWSDDATASSMAQALTKTCRVPVYGIHFATASADLTAASGPTLKMIADLLAKQPTWQVTIAGHTDAVGGEAYNKDLSERRAAAVKTALVATYNVSAGRLSTAGYGQSRPIDSNTTLAGRARNRRVELERKC